MAEDTRHATMQQPDSPKSQNRKYPSLQEPMDTSIKIQDGQAALTITSGK